MDVIICKNCGRNSYYSYYGFCNIFCCADFAHKHNLSVKEATDDIRGERIEELELDLKCMESDRNYYEDMAYECRRYEAMYDEVKGDMKLLKKFEHAEKTLKVHKDMESIKSRLCLREKKINELRDKIDKLEEICQKLRAENKILNSKYTRYEIIELF